MIFLFQEKIAGTLLSTNSRRNGIILAANKNSQIIDSMEVQPGPRKYSLNLGRLIWGENLGTKEIIKALDKLNYVYLQTLGYGNGTKFIGQKIIKRDANLLHIKKDYFLTNFLFLYFWIEFSLLFLLFFYFHIIFCKQNYKLAYQCLFFLII